MANPPSRWLIVTALMLVQALFGIHFVASKALVHFFPPLLWASFRAAVAAAFLIALALLLKRPHPRSGLRFFLPVAGFSLLGVVINQATFLTGLRYTTPANSSVLNTMIPVFTLLIVTLRGMETPSLRRALGFLSAFAGVLVMLRVEKFSLSGNTIYGDLLTLINALSYAFYLAYSKEFIQRHDRLWITAYLFVFGALGLGAAALPDWMAFTWKPLSWDLYVSGLYAIFGGTVLTYFLVTWTLAHTAASQVGLFIYVQPVVASLVAWMTWDMAPGLRTLAGTFFIFVGLYLTQFPGQPGAGEGSDSNRSDDAQPLPPASRAS